MKKCIGPRTRRAAVLVCTIGCLNLSATPAHAALGDVASASTEATTATTRTIAGGTAYVVSYVSEGGTSINEYMAVATGTIFAYTWQGPTQPNLDVLLGRYATDWRRAASAQHSAGRDELHAARVDGTQVEVETSGPMRAYTGRAWLPAALPPGVDEGDLR
jgi:hypothetical protein